MSDMPNGSRGRHFKKPEGDSNLAATQAPSYYKSHAQQSSHAYARPEASSYAEPEVVRVRKKRKRKRSKAPLIALVVVLVLLVAVAGAGVMALFSAKELKGQASSVMQNVGSITDSIQAQDYAGASQAAQHVADSSGAMVDELSSPVWTIASLVPVYGEDITGVRTVAAALKNVSNDALVPLTKSLEANPPASLISSDKTIDVQAASQLFDAVESAAPAMQDCADTLEALPQMHIAQLEDMIGPAKQKFAGINNLFQKAAIFAPLAESVLGASGNRTYLVAAQNSAEMRASGGFPGSIGTLNLNNGTISLGDFTKVYDVFTVETPASVAPTEEENALFGGFMNTARDAGMDPDFTRVAQIWAASYEEQTGTHLDGVISITPSVVQDILSFAGSITLEDGTVLDGSNATKVLQSDLYWKYLSAGTATGEGNDITDALFAQAADLAFDKLFSGLNAETLMKFASCMAEGMENRSVMFWLTDANEQQTLSELNCSGALNTDASKPAVGTFFSLWIGSKMGWYIDINNEVLTSSENFDGSWTYRVKTTFTNTATQDVIASAGSYIAGSLAGFEKDNLYPYVLIYAPAGGSISSFEATNGAQFSQATHDGLQVFEAVRPNLKPGESIVCTYEVKTAAGTQEPLSFMSTPTLTKYR